MSISSIAHTMTSELWPILFSKADSQRLRPFCKGPKNVLLLWSIFNKHSAYFFWWEKYWENWQLYNYNSYIYLENRILTKSISQGHEWIKTLSGQPHIDAPLLVGPHLHGLFHVPGLKIPNQLTSWHLCMPHQIFVFCSAEWCNIGDWIHVDHCSWTV